LYKHFTARPASIAPRSDRRSAMSLLLEVLHSRLVKIYVHNLSRNKCQIHEYAQVCVSVYV